MQKLTTNELRERYQRFFEERGHVRVSSAPLVPENDPTTLFTGSGMQPMLPYLLGQQHPQGARIVNSQKCLRTQDIEEVGDSRHTTVFEMLGNWSLGDYFKKEQISWIFEFLTNPEKGVGLNPKKIFVTVFRGEPNLNIQKDEEAAVIWQKVFQDQGIEANIVDFPERDGMQGGRIFYYDEKKNWWSRAGVPSAMPVGEPGGPDSEMFYDFGKELSLHETSAWKDQLCHVNCDCGRFLEIGNNVFMTYQRREKRFEPLAQKNIDFGGGLERLLAAVINSPDVFQSEAFQKIIAVLETRSGKTYGSDEAATRAFRVIADHIRATVMLAADGVYPSNKTQGYFARRLLRRAIRFAHQLGITDMFVTDLIPVVVQHYAQAYPAVANRESAITERLAEEENRFRQTLARGLKEIMKVENLDGAVAFRMYETYGFPLELTEEIAKERGQKIDQGQFRTEFERHQERSRTATAGLFKGGLSDHSEKSVHYHTATHLLHQALRDVLGTHVFQKGSNITPERLRFDFSHVDKMTPEQIQQVEDVVNQKIQEDLPVAREEMTVAEAKTKGALGLFEEKYADRVSVYSVGDYSREICGGPHVQHTGELGKFKITKEESAGAGIRRIKAVLQ